MWVAKHRAARREPPCVDPDGSRSPHTCSLSWSLPAPLWSLFLLPALIPLLECGPVCLARCCIQSLEPGNLIHAPFKLICQKNGGVKWHLICSPGVQDFLGTVILTSPSPNMESEPRVGVTVCRARSSQP